MMSRIIDMYNTYFGDCFVIRDEDSNLVVDFGIHQNADEVLLKGRIDISDISTEALPKIVVSGEHLDTNNHVNNAQYVAIATSVLPDDFNANIFRAEYKMQSKLGDELYPYLYKENDNFYKVVLKDENQNVKLVCEFIR